MALVQVPMWSSPSCSAIQDHLWTQLLSTPLQGIPSERTVRAARVHRMVQGAVRLAVTRTSPHLADMDPGEVPARLVVEFAQGWSGKCWRLRSARAPLSRDR